MRSDPTHQVPVHGASGWGHCPRVPSFPLQVACGAGPGRVAATLRAHGSSQTQTWGSCPPARGVPCALPAMLMASSPPAPSAQLRKAPRVVSRRLQCHQGGSWPRAVGRETLITAVSALCRPQFDSDVPLCGFLRVSSTCFSVSFLGLHFLSNLETFGQFLPILFCPLLPGPQLHTSGQWVCSRPLMPSHLAGPSSRAFFHLACAACKPTDLRLCGA